MLCGQGLYPAIHLPLVGREIGLGLVSLPIRVLGHGDRNGKDTPYSQDGSDESKYARNRRSREMDIDIGA